MDTGEHETSAPVERHRLPHVPSYYLDRRDLDLRNPEESQEQRMPYDASIAVNDHPAAVAKVVTRLANRKIDKRPEEVLGARMLDRKVNVPMDVVIRPAHVVRMHEVREDDVVAIVKDNRVHRGLHGDVCNTVAVSLYTWSTGRRRRRSNDDHTATQGTSAVPALSTALNYPM